MAPHALWRLAGLTMWFIGAVSIAAAAAEVQGTEAQLLPGNRVLLGSVEDVRSDQARIDTGEGQPRFVPMNVRKDKGAY